MKNFGNFEKSYIESGDFDKYLQPQTSEPPVKSLVNSLIQAGYLSNYKNGVKLGPLHCTYPKEPREVRISSKELDNLLLFTRKTDAVKTKFLREKIRKAVADGSSLPSVLDKYTFKKIADQADKKYLLNNAVFNTYYEKVFTNKHKQKAQNRAETRSGIPEAFTSHHESPPRGHPDSFRFNGKMNYPSGKSFYKSSTINSEHKHRLQTAISFRTDKEQISDLSLAVEDKQSSSNNGMKKTKIGQRPRSCGKLTFLREPREANSSLLAVREDSRTVNNSSNVKIGNLLKSIAKQGESVDVRIPTAKTVVNPLDYLEN